MINFILQGHTLLHDVQTMIQVFYPNEHYNLTDTYLNEGITVESIFEEDKATAKIYEDGLCSGTFSYHFTQIGKNKVKNDIKEQKRVIKVSIYELLKEKTGIEPKWGLITGIRPAKTLNELLNVGYTKDECLVHLIKDYAVSQNKAELTLDVALAERDILKKNMPDDVSIYVGIPFCPTRCLYCSFTSYPLSQYKNKVDLYLDCLIREIKYIGEYARDFSVKTIYIGGGTPTSLNEIQLERLLKIISETFQEAFKINQDMEFTVEAGRPDTITREKLRIMKRFGVNRISINPQTMNEETLKLIGREHSVSDISRVFLEAREEGHENINMDLILGLPNETSAQVMHTMNEIKKLSPDSITIHTLAVKRASRLKETLEQYDMTKESEIEAMLNIADVSAREMGMKPYYMYRQKNMLGNFENLGYCMPNKEGIYNIQIMEEKQTILAVGAGASTKVKSYTENQVSRIFNVKSIEEYIGRIDEMIDRKKEGLPTRRV